MTQLARKASVVGSGTLASRLLGLLRDQIFAMLMGAGHLADAFQLAFRTPHLLRDLLGEGALSGALTPALTRARERGEAFALVNQIGTWLLLAVALITLGLAVFTPQLVELIAGDFGAIPHKLELTTRLARIMLPFLPLVVVAAVSMSLLHAHGHFTWPAFASACFNLAAIAVAVAGWLLGARGADVAVAWALGTLAGGVAQAAIQLPSVWRLGFRPALAFRLSPEARRVLLAFLPAVLGLAAMQVNLFVAMGFASSTPGAASQLAYAFRFLQLPIGLGGVAIGLVTSVEIARAAASGRSTAADAALGLRLIAFVTLPATVGLYLLAVPIIRFLYERGQFSAEDTFATAAVLRAFALGMVAYGAVKVLAPALYALGRVRWALVAAAASITANAVWCAAATDAADLALGTSIASGVNALVLLIVLGVADPALWRALLGLIVPVGKMGLAAGGCGAAAWICFRGAYEATGIHALSVLVACAIGALVYAGCAGALRLEEIAAIVRRIDTKRTPRDI